MPVYVSWVGEGVKERGIAKIRWCWPGVQCWGRLDLLAMLKWPHSSGCVTPIPFKQIWHRSMLNMISGQLTGQL